MAVHKLVFTLSLSTLLISCSFQILQQTEKSELTDTNQSTNSIPLKSAIEELRVMKIKVESKEGINRKEYGEDLEDLVNIVKKANGNSKVVVAVKSAVAGHQLAYQFWQCNQIEGYEQLHECQDKILQRIFVKYPDIAAQSQSVVAGQNLTYISAALDEQALLQAIWQKTGEDTEIALQVVNPAPDTNLPAKK